MKASSQKKKFRRPVTRLFWPILQFLPAFIRSRIVRAQFDIDQNLPSSLVLKQAESESEIFQALNLVYGSYLDLDYIDPNETAMRFNKYLAHPNTVILIAKMDEEVLGTISIISDSAMGLPSDDTWPLNSYRTRGRVIAEISSLAIKKDFKLRRGKLLFPLCKEMYLFCRKILKVDGIVISTRLEVEPFYTDVLLFEKVVKKTGQQNHHAKGAPSTCCYLDLTTAPERYQKTYSQKPDIKNLAKYFLDESDPRFQIPEAKLSIQAYTKVKNEAQTRLYKKYPSLVKDLSYFDVSVINANTNYIGENEKHSENLARLKRERSLRAEIRCEAWIFLPDNKLEPIRCRIMDISRTGLRLVFAKDSSTLATGMHCALVAQTGTETIFFKVEVKWINEVSSAGVLILESSPNFSRLIELIEADAFDNKVETNKKTKNKPA